MLIDAGTRELAVVWQLFRGDTTTHFVHGLLTWEARMSARSGRVVVVTGGTRGHRPRPGARAARAGLPGRRSAVAPATSVDAAVGVLSEAAPGRVSGVPADVTDRAAVQALWDHAVATFGRVDVWINNAGLSSPRLPLPDVPADDGRRGGRDQPGAAR